MRYSCLRSLANVISWPTVFGMAKIPRKFCCWAGYHVRSQRWHLETSDSPNLKSTASTYLQLRPRIYKTLIFSLRNETDALNLQLTLGYRILKVIGFIRLRFQQCVPCWWRKVLHMISVWQKNKARRCWRLSRLRIRLSLRKVLLEFRKFDQYCLSTLLDRVQVLLDEM